MLSTTATLDKYRKRPNAKGTFLLIIYGDTPTKTFYLSDQRITLSSSGEKFEGIVKSWGELNQKIELFTKKTNIKNISITLNNAPYRHDGTSMISISDDLYKTKFINRKAEVYLWFEGITSLSDCLKVFQGVIQTPKNVTPEEMALPIYDSTPRKHLILSQSTISTTDWPDAPVESVGKYLPIAYGDFSLQKDDGAPRYGPLIEGIWVAADKAVFSGHVLKSVTDVWFWAEDIKDLIRLESGQYTVTLDDNGKTTIQFNNITDPTFEIWLYPETSLIQHNDAPAYIFDDAEKADAHDRNINTRVDATVESYQSNGNQDAEHSDNYQGYLPDVDIEGELQNIYTGIRYVGDFNPTLVQLARFFFVDPNDQQAVTPITTLGAGGASTFTETEITTNFNQKGLTLADLTYPTKMQIDVIGKKRVGDGSRKKLFEIYDIRLRLINKRPIQTNMRVFIEGEGRAFGSWIDNIGRSNSYNAGELIENPAHIIESILRDELGLTDSEIDEDAFDYAGSKLTSWNLVLSLTEPENSEAIIQRIAKQSKLNFFFSSQNQGKVAIIDDGTNSEDDTLSLNYIRMDGLKLEEGQLKYLVNSVRVNYLPWIISNDYEEYTTAENTTSQSDYAVTRELHINAPNIMESTVADSLRDHYAGSSGFWKDLKEVLEVEMLSFEKVHWEVGDIIKPDSSLNTVLKKFGENWEPAGYAPLMMIIEKKLSPSSLKFKMMRVATTGAPP